MRRRDLITVVGAMAAAVLLVLAATLGRAAAQQPGKVYRIAVVEQFEISDTSSDPAVARGPGAFFDELRRLGYVEGKNLVRWI
jgi:hypothetical protein